MGDLQVGLLGLPGWLDFNRLTGGTVVCDIPTALKKDILIFTGGEDVDPSVYGGINRYCQNPNIERDTFERAVLIRAIAYGIKVLGVCRGHQFVNAVLGGWLTQDIYKETGKLHDIVEHDFGMWPRKFWKNESLSNLFPFVNTYHHQAVSIPGKGQGVILRAKDGIIESTTNSSGSIVTFQFHPEWDGIGKAYFQKVMETGNLIW
jgi:putative glutamine amidotransferase